jgi:hypothetical protein
MHPGRRNGNRVVGQRAWETVAVPAVSDAVEDDGVDVEPEAERSTTEP